MATSKPYGFLTRLALKAIHRAALALHAHTHTRARKSHDEAMAVFATTTDPNARNAALQHHQETMSRIAETHDRAVDLLDKTEELLGIS